MAIDIYAVHMEPSNASDHEHIAAVRWRNSDDSGKTGENTRQQIVEWLRASSANVARGQRRRPRAGGRGRRVAALPPHVCGWPVDEQPARAAAVLTADCNQTSGGFR